MIAHGGAAPPRVRLEVSRPAARTPPSGPPTRVTIEPRAEGPYRSGMLECRFQRDVGSLEAVFEFVARFFQEQGIDPERAYEVDLVIEELFTNMVKYGRGGGPEIELALDYAGSTVTIVLRDFDVEPYDITLARPVDTSAPLSERRAGGLGLHLVKQVADSVRYAHDNHNTTITVTKRLTL
jgi:serine/threonine-protein kinase RsbW